MTKQHLADVFALGAAEVERFKAAKRRPAIHLPLGERALGLRELMLQPQPLRPRGVFN